MRIRRVRRGKRRADKSGTLLLKRQKCNFNDRILKIMFTRPCHPDQDDGGSAAYLQVTKIYETLLSPFFIFYWFLYAELEMSLVFISEIWSPYSKIILQTFKFTSTDCHHIQLALDALWSVSSEFDSGESRMHWLMLALALALALA